MKKQDEEQKSKSWRMILIVTSSLILLIAAYFLFQLFTGNPLAGTWVSQDGDVELTIRKNNVAIVTCKNLVETQEPKIRFQYVLDKEANIISFQMEQASLQNEVKDLGENTIEEAIVTEIGALDNTFDYNMSRKKLVLAEREYGEKIVFLRK